MAVIDAAELRRLIRYEPDTGEFYWRASGKRAGCDSDGYRNIMIHQKSYRAHRLAWLYMTGEWPLSDLDHRDTVRNNNRWKNLRLASPTENNRNKGPNRLNKSGYKGVSYYRRDGRWLAQIMADGKRTFLGYFSTAEEAGVAYQQAAKRLHGDFSRPA